MGEPTREVRTHRWVLAAGTVALVALHLWISARISGPSVVYDEAGYLGNARWIAGDRNWAMPYSPAYAMGYPVVLAPIFALIHDPEWQWRAALMLNAVLLASVFPLLAAVLRTVFGVARPRAIAAAALGAIVPAVVAAGISAIAENLVLPLVLASVLAAFGMADQRAPRRAAWWFGLVAAGLYAAHPRFTLALPVAAATIAAAHQWGRRDRIVTAVNAAGLVLAAGLAHQLNAWIQATRWRDVQRPEGGVQEIRGLLTSKSGLAELFETAAGQAWYLVVGSLGLVALGLWLAVTALRRPTPIDVPDADADADDADPRLIPARVAVGWFLGAAGAVFATSVLFFARNQFRIDHYVYGRHNDSFTPLWVGLAVAFLLSARPSRRKVTAVLATLIPIVGLGLVVNLTRSPLDFDGSYSPFASPAIVRAVDLDPSRAFAMASILAVVGVGVLASAVAASSVSVVRKTIPSVPAIVVAAGVAGWFLYSGFGTASGTANFAEYNYSYWNAPTDVERLGINQIAIDASAVRSRAVLQYPFWLPDVAFTTYNAQLHQDPESTYVLAELTDPDRRAAGDRIVLLDEGGLYAGYGSPEGLALWVRPGAEQDRLAAEGRLLPADFPSELPAAAQQADLEIVDLPTQPREVAPGGGIPLTIRLRHTGTGSPWPDRASFALPGHVRVVALITPVDPDGVVGGRSGGELAAWMAPGDEVTQDVEVVAVGQFTEPLPAGEYRVELAVAQQGYDWVTRGGADATFTMVVRG